MRPVGVQPVVNIVAVLATPIAVQLERAERNVALADGYRDWYWSRRFRRRHQNGGGRSMCIRPRRRSVGMVKLPMPGFFALRRSISAFCEQRYLVRLEAINFSLHRRYALELRVQVGAISFNPLKHVLTRRFHPLPRPFLRGRVRFASGSFA
jgi:hypothetical protein